MNNINDRNDETRELANDEHEFISKNFLDANYTSADNFKNRKNSKKSKILSYAVVGIICSVLGGTVSTAASLYILPKTNLFKNSPLYQSVSQNYSNSVSPSSLGTSSSSLSVAPVSSNKGALTVAEIAKRVGPAVVGINVTSAANSDAFGFSQGQQQGSGSGIIISEDGYILTNYHVINGADKIQVVLNNKQQVSAKVINYNAQLDLAIIKVTQNVKMPAVAELGTSSQMQVGDPVVAIGNPLGMELYGTVTTGIVSAMNRQVQASEGSNATETYIQTDAAINPGNSGGALVNNLGQVIGINSAKIGGNGVEGIGFAIPIDIVKPQLNSLLKPVLKLGIEGRDITSDLSEQYNIPQGVYVAQVQEFSAAEKAGLQVGDVIEKFDGKTVKSVNDINTIKAQHKAGDKVQIDINRNGSNKTLTLTLSE